MPYHIPIRYASEYSAGRRLAAPLPDVPLMYRADRLDQKARYHQASYEFELDARMAERLEEHYVTAKFAFETWHAPIQTAPNSRIVAIMFEDLPDQAAPLLEAEPEVVALIPEGQNVVVVNGEYVVPRRFKRVPIYAEIMLYSSAGRHKAHLSDISEVGCHVDSPVAVRADEEVAIDFRLLGADIRTRGRVAFAVEGVGFGLEFLKLPPVGRELIAAYVRDELRPEKVS